MNQAYRLLWSLIKKCWIVVAENFRAKGKLATLAVSALVLTAAVMVGAPPVAALDPGALPTGGQIVAGSGNITTSGSAMTVNQTTQRMVADWATFNIGQNASVAFQQPGASAAALNRISDQNPSQILGSLSANGQIFLLNPAGIIFGQSAQVNVGALVASSLGLSTENFMAGKYSFKNCGGAGSILNQGTIRTADGGYVAFLGPQVKNEGSITATGGSVVMAAADKVSLDFDGDGLLSYSVEQGAVDALAENKGLIKADGGMVVMTAKAADSLTSAVVNSDGVIEARGITSQGGRILLDAEDGMTTVGGTLDTSSDTAAGGRVVATGERVWVKNGALLTASGATGGGEVLVGGSWQNSDTSVHQVTGTVIEAGASLEANATNSGNGGTVVAWSDITNPLSVTRAYGSFEAKGGPNGGNGGRIETSGHWLDVAGSQGGASADHGLAGVWLFDPYNVTITGAGANGSWAGGNPDVFSPTDTGSTISAATIATKLEDGTSVTVTTNGGGGEIGDITISSAITKADGNTDVTLTMNAANSIVVDQAISNTGGSGKLNVVLDADNNNGTGDGAGIVLLNADITTGGGSLSFGTGRTATIGGVSTLVGGDVFVGGGAAQTISTNGGTVDVNGEMLIANTNGLTINSNGGNVRFHGLLNSGNQYTFVDKSGAGETESWSDARTEAINGTGGSSAVNDSYLVTITSRLENAVAVRASGYKGAWIGAYRKDYTNGNWFWADGPEANQQFFTQTTNGSGGVTTAGYYSNFGAGEPNGSMTVADTETVGQFYGTLGQWNDLKIGTPYNKAADAEQYKVRGFIRETNLAASPLTINAGAGTVTFSGAVGSSKALASLNVTSTGGIAINGGAVTTEGVQTYNGNVTLGAATTTLTQTAANTDFTIQSGKTITNAYGADASLTVKTTGSILMNSGSSISSSTGKLNTILWSDSDNSASGYVFIHDGNTISTNGGNIVMAGGLDDGANGGTASDGIPDGYAVSTVATASGVSIGRNANAATAATTITSGGGNILMRGKSTGGSPSMGIHYAYGGTLYAGSGTLTMLGEATSYAGIELSAWLDGAGASYLDINAGTVDIRGTSSNTNYHGLASSQLNNEYTCITAGAGGIYLYGHNTANTAKGVEISLNAVTTGGGNITVESPNYIAIYGGANAHSFNAGTGNTTLKSNLLSIGANHTFSGSGTLTVEAYTAARSINVGTTGAGTLDIASSYFSTNFVNGFSGITVGNTMAGAITVGGATTLNDSTTLLNNSTIAINGAITANENLALTSNGVITQTGALGVTGTTIITAGSGNNITLSNTNNNFTGTLSVPSGNNVSLIDSNDMNLGAFNATGTIDVATLTGNLTLTGAVATTNTSANAIKLNAGKNAAAGTAAGGDILVTGGSVSTGAGGYANLYSGSVSGSTGLTALVGSGSGRFRYNSDETNANYTTALTAGTNAIYREQPAVTVTASSGTKTYDGAAYSGGNGVTYAGFVNGDTSASLGGTLAYGGTIQGAVNAGSYTIVPSGYTSGLGYALTYANGSLTITPAALTVTANNATKTYGDTTTFTGSEFSSSGLQNGETIGSVTLGSAGAAATANVAGSPYSIIASNATGGTFSAGNYDITYANGQLTITPAPLTITASNDSRVYSGIPYSGGNGVVYTGFVAGETDAVLSGVLAYGGTSQGAINAGSYSIVPGGLISSNYAISFVDGLLTITGAPSPVPEPEQMLQNILASITSPQPHQNGTQDQQTVGGASGGQGSVYMGPGAGSSLFSSVDGGETSQTGDSGAGAAGSGMGAAGDVQFTGVDMGGLLIDRTGYRTDEELQEQM